MINPFSGLGNSNSLKHVNGALLRLAASVVQVSLNLLGDLNTDFQIGIKTGHWILEYHGHTASANVLQSFFGHFQ